MATEEAVREELREVIDPELGINIVDLGLIYDITADGEGVHVLMTLTTPGCPLHGVFRELVTEAAAKVDGVAEEDVDVELTFEPPWNKDKMSDEAKAELNMI